LTNTNWLIKLVYMNTATTTVGAFRAKTHLAELLERVRRGATIIIAKRGTPIARLVPYREASGGQGRRRALALFDGIRAGVVGRVNVRRLIDEGRRH
jgi:prevent-host-death family protein